MRKSTFLLVCIFGVCQLPAQDFLLQAWYWDYPKPLNPYGNPAAEQTWAKTLEARAAALSQAGFTYVWLPPVCRSASGSESNGYDPKDLYDLGGFGLGATGFGFRQDLDKLVQTFQDQGIKAVADVVYNHRDGGAAQDNPSVKQYITQAYSDAVHANPFPSDRYRVVLPLGGKSGNGAGDYYFKVSSKTQNPRFFQASYKVYMETGKKRWQDQPDGAETEPNGGADCNQESTAISLGRNFHARIDASGCLTDEFKLSLSSEDFDSAGDDLYIYLNNLDGTYSDHRIYGIWNSSANAELLDQLRYQTFTDFSAMPSGKGRMTYQNFRPNGGSVEIEKLDGDYHSMLFFYDYDQSVVSTQTALFDWTAWLWEEVGFRGFRMDAVKHFDPAFTAKLMNHLHQRGIDPGLMVGEYFDYNAAALNSWVNRVKANMDAETQAATDLRVFDFALRQSLKNACDQFGYDVREVFRSGIVDELEGDPFSVITFINNHDLRHRGEPIQQDPMLAYAYILTNNQIGLPCVFYPDYSGLDLSPEYPQSKLQIEIDRLIQAHKNFIYQSSSADYLNRQESPYSANYLSGYPNTSLLYQLSGGVAGKEVLVAINFAGEPLDVVHQINPSNVSPGEYFTDVLSLSTGGGGLVLSENYELRFQLPARSYSIWVEGVLSPMPMGLSRFEASTMEDFVELEWEVQNEGELRAYEIERSLDGEVFQEIAQVQAIGKPGEGAAYLYLDREIAGSGYFYYRLKAIKADSSFDYSDIKVAYFREELSGIELLSNPSTHVAVLVFESRYNNLITLEIFDAGGQLVRSEKISVNQGFNRLKLDLSGQPEGVYFIKLQTPGLSKWTGRLIRTDDL